MWGTLLQVLLWLAADGHACIQHISVSATVTVTASDCPWRCGSIVLSPLQGIMVQKTGNFAGASLIFGVFLLIVGSLIIVLKYLLAWEERRRAKQLADSRRCSEAGAAGAGGVVPVRAEHAVTLGNADGKAHGCAAEDAAADVGGAVVMRTDRETNVRPRTLASGGTSGQGL